MMVAGTMGNPDRVEAARMKTTGVGMETGLNAQ